MVFLRVTVFQCMLRWIVIFAFNVKLRYIYRVFCCSVRRNMGHFCGEAISWEIFGCLFVRIISSVGEFVYVWVHLSVCLLVYLLAHSFNYVHTFVWSPCFVCLFVRLCIRVFIYLLVLISFGKMFVVRAPERRAVGYKY